MIVEYIDLLINKQEQVTSIWIDKVLLNIKMIKGIKCIIRLFIIRLDNYMDLSTVLFFSDFFIIEIKNRMLLYMYAQLAEKCWTDVGPTS